MPYGKKIPVCAMMSNKPIAFFKIGDTIENRRRNFLEDH